MTVARTQWLARGKSSSWYFVLVLSLCLWFWALLCLPDCIRADTLADREDHLSRVDSAALVLERFRQTWDSLRDYSCIVETYSRKGKKEEFAVCLYKYLKPGWVRIKVLEGKNQGGEAVYDPTAHKVVAWKGGVFSFIKKTFDADDPKVRSLRGTRLSDSHWGTLLERASQCLASGRLRYLGTLVRDGSRVLVLELFPPPPAEGVLREVWWIEPTSFFPVRLEQYDDEGKILHYSNYRNVTLNSGLNKDDFRP